jgi:hypothetical protein
MAIELTTAPESTLSAIRASLEVTSINEVVNQFLVPLPGATFAFQGVNNYFFATRSPGFKADFSKIEFSLSRVNLNSLGISQIVGANTLSALQDAGTNYAIFLSNNYLSADQLNDFFQELPVTNKTATIDVANNPGAATCNTTIAQNKGYIVVTS